MKGSGALSPAARSAAPSSSAPSRADRFRLNGPSARLDPRTHAVRRDVADVALAAQVFAPHYARAALHGCAVARTPVFSSPSADAVAVSELLLGEDWALLDVSGEWGWGYSPHDGYVGYLPCAALGPRAEPSHVVAAPAALVFSAPDIKSRVVRRLPMGARLAGVAGGNGFVAVADGFVHERHVAGLDEPLVDPVAVAERLLGVPYRWGGRSGDGIDCSGLVQLAFAFCGVDAPRDSDQQRALGAEATGEARRGDLVFLPGHVGLMADADTLVHANAHWMAVTREPLADVLARLPGDNGVLARRRLSW